MPPQFFKDAHNGLGNKFIPRAFAFNIGGMATNPGGSENGGSGDTSANSDSASIPQASSTAPSTSGSSHFFIKVKDHGGMEGSASSSVPRHKKSKSSSMENAECPVKDVTHNTNSLSIHAIEQIGEEIRSGICEEEDDIQITDIRELSHDAINGEISNPHGEESVTSNETSSDLLLEALYKSQKLCTMLKEKLEAANSKIQGQNDELETQKTSVEKMKDALKKLKSLLSDLESKSFELKRSRLTDSTAVANLKAEYLETSKRMLEYKEHILNFQQKVDHLKQIKLASNFEVDKRNKEIKTLKAQLDDTKGLLSEQKIRTIQLEKILETTRKQYDGKIEEMLTKSDASQTAFAEKLTLSVKAIDNVLKDKLGGVSPALIGLGEGIEKKIESLSEQLLNSLKVSSEDTATGIQGGSDRVTGVLKSNQDEIEAVIALHSIVAKKCQTSIEETLLQLSELFTSLVDETRDASSSSTSLCREVLENIAKLDKGIKDQNLAIGDVSDWKNKYEFLNSECSLLSNSLKVCEAENSKLQSELVKVKAEIGTLEKSKEDIRLELEAIKIQLESKSAILKSSEEKASKCKSSCESKLRTQLELFRLVSEERDSTRSDLEEARSKILSMQNHLTHQHTLNLEHEQSLKELTKLMSEKEERLMELEKENSTLKHEIERLQESFAQHQVNMGVDDLSLIVSPVSETAVSKHVDPARKGKKAVHPCKAATQTKSKKTTNAVKVAKENQQPKRTILDMTEDDDYIFNDDFELDSIHDEAPVIPKRYVKRKKTAKA